MMSVIDKPSIWLDKLTRRIESLDDWAQRTIFFGRSIFGIAPEEATTCFSTVVANAFRLRQNRFVITSNAAFLSIAKDHWPKEHRTHTREAAVAQGDRLTLLFLVQPTQTGFEDDDSEVPNYGSERPLTLGERKALASTPARRVVEMAMLDPHPAVAIKLLGNPKLTEDDVVRIAARRMSSPAVLAQIAFNTRWRMRRRVAFALVNNPGLTSSIGVSLIPGLTASDVAQVAADNRLPGEIRECAAALLEVV